jgi:hypothetical protein
LDTLQQVTAAPLSLERTLPVGKRLTTLIQQKTNWARPIRSRQVISGRRRISQAPDFVGTREV